MSHSFGNGLAEHSLLLYCTVRRGRKGSTFPDLHYKDLYRYLEDGFQNSSHILLRYVRGILEISIFGLVMKPCESFQGLQS